MASTIAIQRRSELGRQGGFQAGHQCKLAVRARDAETGEERDYDLTNLEHVQALGLEEGDRVVCNETVPKETEEKDPKTGKFKVIHEPCGRVHRLVLPKQVQFGWKRVRVTEASNGTEAE